MKSRFKKKSGFTLIEVVVGLAIFAIICLALVSIMTVSFRVNYINRDSYTADNFSKAFFEGLKDESVRPPKKTVEDVDGKVYYGLFSDLSDVDKLINESIKTLSATKNVLPGSDPNNDLKSAMNDVNQRLVATGSNAEVGFIVKIRWDNGKHKIYEVETWTWVFDKGESSLVNRVTLMPGS